MTKTLGSGGSGSVIQSHWSADPEPCQNVTLVCQKTGGWCQNNWGGRGGSLSDPCYGFQMFISDPLPLLFQKSKPEQEPLLFKS